MSCLYRGSFEAKESSMSTTIEQRQVALNVRLSQMKELDEWHLFQNFVRCLMPHDSYTDVRHSAARNDFGRDAVAVTPDGKRCVIAVSFDCSLAKIRKDVNRWTQDPHREEASVILFATYDLPSEMRLSSWRAKIRNEFDLDLRLYSRDTILATATREPIWQQTCSQLGIRVDASPEPSSFAGQFRPMHVQAAVISTFDKQGLDKLAPFLTKRGCLLISSPGTLGYLKQYHIETVSPLEYTGTESIYDLRGTLHPHILASIKADRSKPHMTKELEQLGLRSIDLAIVNSRRFQLPAADPIGVLQHLSDVQIGGPALLRWAVRHWETCTPIIHPKDYDAVITELDANEMILGPTMRSRLFKTALRYLAECDRETADALDSLSFE